MFRNITHLIIVLISSFALNSANAQTGTCTPPTGITTSLDTNKITINWAAATSGTNVSYVIEYSELPTSTGSVQTATSTTNTVTLTGLKKCTSYGFRIKTVCSSNLSSTWAVGTVVTTKGCSIPCATPSFTVTSDSTSVKVAWTAVTGNTYEIQYTAAPATATSTWTNVPTTSSPATITGLTKCKEYVVRVRTKCATGNTSDWVTKAIKTTGCVVNIPCATPSFTVTSDSTSVKVAWTAVTGNTYEIQYTAAPATATSTWTNVPTTSNPATITGLTNCKEYVVRVRTKCTTGNTSDWVTKTIKTTGCVVNIPCATPSFTVTSDSTSVKVALTAVTGNTYEIQYTAAPATATSTWTNVPTTSNPATISGLTNCKEYVVRVRTKCTTGNTSDWVTKTIKTTGCIVNTPCATPSFTVTSDSTSVKVAWTAITGNTYEIQYTTAPVTTSSTWTNATTTTNPTTISGLTKCKEYVVRVRTKCATGNTSDWVMKTIKTTGCIVNTPCATPSFTVTSDSTSVKVAWTAITGNSYEIQYTAAPVTTSSTWTNATATTNPTTISGLTKCKEYVVRVRTKCATGNTSDWVMKTIKTTGCIVNTPCATPSFTVTSDSTSVKVAWTAITGNTYEIQYTTAPVTTSSTWTNATTTTNPTTISGLTKCKEYVVRVRTKCATGNSSDWVTKTIKTTGCIVNTPCATPSFTVTSDSTSVKVAWTAITGNSYEIQYTTAPVTTSSTWTNATATTNPTTISGLTKCKEYVVRVRTKCATGNTSDWVTKTIKTTGCVVNIPCTTPSFTVTSDSTSVKVAWAAVTGNTYEIQYTAAPATATSTWTNVPTTSNPATITGLTKCKEYVVRVRTKCADVATSDWVTKTIKTTGCILLPCPLPYYSISIDSTKIKVSWVASTGATVEIQYTTAPQSTTSTWTNVVTSTMPATISGLTKCKEYVIRIRTKCANGAISDWLYKTVKTSGCSTCPTPINLQSEPITGGVILNWSGVGLEYELRYSKKTVGTVAWTTLSNISSVVYTLSGLETCSFYAWQVRVKCQNGTWSDWSKTAVFETGGCQNRIAKILSVYPNPGTNLNIDYTIPNSGKILISLVNLQGKVEANYDLGYQNLGTHHFEPNDLNIPAGVYIITISLDGVKKEVQRWVKTTE